MTQSHSFAQLIQNRADNKQRVSRTNVKDSRRICIQAVCKIHINGELRDKGEIKTNTKSDKNH